MFGLCDVCVACVCKCLGCVCVCVRSISVLINKDVPSITDKKLFYLRMFQFPPIFEY